MTEDNSLIRQMAETIGVVFWLADAKEPRLLYISAAYDRLWGRARERLYTHYEEFFEAIHPDDRERVQLASSRCVLQEQFETEYRIVRPDGEMRWIRDRGFLIRDQAGAPDRIAGFAEDVTDTKQLEHDRQHVEIALRDSEARFRNLGEALPLIVSQSSPDGQIEYVNSYWTTFSGRTPAEFANGDWLTAIHPDDQQTVLEQWQQALATGLPYEYEFRAQSIDGSYRWLLARGTPVYVADGRLTNWINTAVDIHDRKRAEVALRENEARQTFLLRLSDGLRSLSDPVEIQAVVTRTAMHYFAADRCYYCEIEDGNAIIRRDAARADLPSVVGVYSLRHFALFQAVVDAGRPFTVRNVQTTDLVDEDLRQLCIQLQVISFVDVPVIKNGKPVGILCLVQGRPRNWTDLEVELVVETAERTWAAVERARTEAALAQSEAKYRSLFTSINEGYALCELLYDNNNAPIDWKILEVNPAFEALTGITHAAGKIAEQLNQLLDTNWLQTFATVAQTGESTRFEHHVSSIDYWFEVLVSRIAADQQHIIVVFNDITARKQAEAGLRESEEKYRRLNQQLEQRVQERTAQLEVLNQELEAFSHSVSHDLKTPLSYITMTTERLARNLNVAQLDAASQRYLQIIAQSALRAGAMVDDLLEFSRVGWVEMRWITVPMNSLVQRVQQQLLPETLGRSIRWQVEPLPTVQGDPAMLRLVWQNLLSNAIKYTRDRAEAIITIGSCVSEHETVFFVQDNGAGFDMKYRDRLFNIFQRLHTQDQFAGTGVGLANVRRIIHRHGGRTWAEGAIDQGATIYFSLPKQEEQA